MEYFCTHSVYTLKENIMIIDASSITPKQRLSDASQMIFEIPYPPKTIIHKHSKVLKVWHGFLVKCVNLYQYSSCRWCLIILFVARQHRQHSNRKYSLAHDKSLEMIQRQTERPSTWAPLCSWVREQKCLALELVVWHYFYFVFFARRSRHHGSPVGSEIATRDCKSNQEITATIEQ